MKIFLLVASLFFIKLSIGQNKLLTIQEAVLKNRTTLAPQKLQALSFVSNSKNFTYIDNNTIFICSNAKGNVLHKISLIELNKNLKANQFDTLIDFTSVKVLAENKLSLVVKQNELVYDFIKKTVAPYSSKKEDFSLEAYLKEPKSGNYSYCKNNNLFVVKNNVESQVTTDGAYEIVYNGKNIHQNEFGIDGKNCWSTNGNFLAFYRMDQSMVNDYPIIDWTKKPAKNVNIKYPMAGNLSHHVTVGIYNVNTAKTIFVKTEGDKEQYLTNIAWSPDEKHLYIAVLSRTQNDMKLNEYDATTGNFVRTLFEEHDDKYTEPLNPMVFLRNNPTQFIWQSRRDGYKHFYLYHINGTLIKQLTKGNWEVKADNGFDATGEQLFFHANEQSPINQDLYSVSLKTGVISRLTAGGGFHKCTLDDNKEFFIDEFSSAYIPRDYNIVNTKTKNSVSVFKAPNPVKDYKMGNYKVFSIKNNEGTDLFCRLITPIDFDSTKKYPVLVYLYNGPHSQLVTNSWMGAGDMWLQYMAQKGFVVFTLDGRGTNYRGRDFEQATHRQLGTKEMEDQIAGVNYLKSLSYVDGNRVGVHGWSFGGFVTTSLMTRNPDIFKVAVAGGPVIDWSYYEIMYTERYMDSPQDNKAGYDKNNLLNYVDKLKGKLLIIHGAQDPIVVLQHSIMYQKKAIDKGVQLDFYLYPGHEHNVSGKDRAHLMEKITNYFIEHL